MKTRDLIIDRKIRVLRDFCIVTKENEKDIRWLFKAEFNRDPDKDLNVIADRVSNRLINAKLLEHEEYD